MSFCSADIHNYKEISEFTTQTISIGWVTYKSFKGIFLANSLHSLIWLHDVQKLQRYISFVQFHFLLLSWPTNFQEKYSQLKFKIFFSLDKIQKLQIYSMHNFNVFLLSWHTEITKIYSKYTPLINFHSLDDIQKLQRYIPCTVSMSFCSAHIQNSKKISQLTALIIFQSLDDTAQTYVCWWCTQFQKIYSQPFFIISYSLTYIKVTKIYSMHSFNVRWRKQFKKIYLQLFFIIFYSLTYKS